MAEYIEREEVIKMAGTNKAVCQCLADIVDVKDIVNCVPAADVAPVVRCKDCKKWGEHGICNEFTSEKLPTGGRIAFKTNDNDYCSYGVRIEGEQG